METFPCYGALLQVLLGPPQSAPLTDYPFFMDFEPKKREVYEIATEARERLSRSLSELNVQKGTTTTETHEELDILTGVSGGVNIGTVGVSGGVSGQWGTRDITQQERANLRTTDDAREKREAYSFTTQLTQMYHQFLSYHLGTNRAVFFILPRPHTVTSDQTFVNGPIQLQGIQEVFLVVNRPKTMNAFCLEAHLETAHLELSNSNSRPEQTEIIKSFENFAEVPAEGDRTNPPAPHDQIDTFDAEVEFGPGWRIDRDRGAGGYGAASGFDIVSGTEDRKHVDMDPQITVTDRGIRIWSRASWGYYNRRVWFVDIPTPEPGWFRIALRVYLIQEAPTTEQVVEGFVLTGRGLCCGSGCTPPILKIPSDYVPHEKVPDDPRYPRFYTGKATSKAIFENNRLIKHIRDFMVKSIGSAKRYPFGKVNFYEADFFANRIARRIQENHPDNMPLSKVPGVDPTIRDKVIGKAGDIRRKPLLSLPLQEMITKLGITEDEGRYLRAAVMGFPVQPPRP